MNKFITLAIAAAVAAGMSASSAPAPKHKAAQGEAKSAFTKVSELKIDRDAASPAAATPRMQAAAAQSDVTPVFATDFNAASDLDQFTILDANGDDISWTHYFSGSNGAARCRYNSSASMDDWLITPALELEGGKKYVVQYRTGANGLSYTESIEVLLGTAPSPDAMTEVISEPVDLNFLWVTAEMTYKVITPAVTGTYYIGFHGISQPDQYWLYVDDIAIGDVAMVDIPGKITDFHYTPTPGSPYKGTVAFKAPAVNVVDEALSSITKIEVTIDGELAYTLDNPAPGEEISFEIDFGMAGNYYFVVTAYNNLGAGPAAQEIVYAGTLQPAAPTNVKIAEIGESGKVTVTWGPVATDFNGDPIAPEKITYLVCIPGERVWEPVHEEPLDHTVTTYTFQYAPEGTIDFAQVAVFAETEGGSNGTPCDNIPLGPAYSEVEESFAGAEFSYRWGAESDFGNWGIADDEAFEDLSSYDGDNGSAFMEGMASGGSGRLLTAKIALPSAEANPAISFYAFCLGADDSNYFTVLVREIGGEWQPAGDVIINNLQADDKGWYNVHIPLTSYAGKTVQIAIEAVAVEYLYCFIDNIRIGAFVDNDLELKAVTAPAKVNAGEDYDVTVTVRNRGLADAGEFTVELYADGENVAAATVEGLAAGATLEQKFNMTMSALATSTVELSAAIVYTADENDANNTCAPVEVEPKTSDLPAVADLSVAESGEGFVLTWTEPSLGTGAPTLVEEDFESCPAGVATLEGWTFIDLDDCQIGEDFNFDNMPADGVVSFFVVDSNHPAFAYGFEAHSGTKSLGSMYTNPYTVDDWVITPRLSGEAQTVSMWARSNYGSYPESFTACYSTTGTDPDDFIEIASEYDLPETWLEYSYELPEGALYFAVHNHDTDAYMLQLDDFSFYTAGTDFSTLCLLGYEIYRDGVLITPQPVEECTYTDSDAEGAHTYQVVVVYDKGRSAGSNAVSTSPSGIGSIAVESGNAVYYDLQGIRVDRPESGRIYIRVADGRASKVLVK